jgi:hypothetical protein
MKWNQTGRDESWRVKKETKLAKQTSTWKRWFAYKPVYINGHEMVWLCFVQRRWTGEYWYSHSNSDFIFLRKKYEYREIER